ncbi:MAG TPA: chemotaxis protein CheD [Bacillota bacterium]|nr:chemotaxis protein CheD [Bacillota bacterium]HOL09474.1 chemotaxis protein CheD [Bacillota bacterium]
MEPTKYYLQPGYIFISKEPYLIHTVLGSCVSVCLWDSVLKFGGMNHFIYSHHSDVRTGRYGDVAIPYLIRLMQKHGSDLKNLKAHLIGGAESIQLNSMVGRVNAKLAEELLQKYQIEVVTRDLGGHNGRKVIFNNLSGEILIYKVNNIRESDWYNGTEANKSFNN